MESNTLQDNFNDEYPFFYEERQLLSRILHDEDASTLNKGVDHELFSYPAHKQIYFLLADNIKQNRGKLNTKTFYRDLVALNVVRDEEIIDMQETGVWVFDPKIQIGKLQENKRKHYMAKKIAYISDHASNGYSSIEIAADLEKLLEEVRPKVEEEKIEQKYFPIHVFPRNMAKIADQVCSVMRCPIDFFAMPMMIAASTFIGNSRRIEIQDNWTTGASLYWVCIGNPAAMKTPPQKKIINILNRFQKQYLNDYEREMKGHKERMAIYELDKAAWKADYKKNIKKPMPEEPEKPSKTKIWTQDITGESCAKLLENNPRGICIWNDELSGWIGGMNQYKQGGKGREREFFLSCWSQAPIDVERLTDDSCRHIPLPFISVMGGLQPDKIYLLQGKYNDGFFDRMLISYPQAKVERINRDARLGKQWENELYMVYSRLSFLKMEDGNPVVLKAASDAKEAYSDWFDSIVDLLNSKSFPSHLHGPYAKMREICQRFALIFTALDHSSICQKKHIDSAVELSEYFLNQVRVTYSQLDETLEEKDANRVLEWMKRTERVQATRRDILTYVRGTKPASKALSLMVELVESGKVSWHGKNAIRLNERSV